MNQKTSTIHEHAHEDDEDGSQDIDGEMRVQDNQLYNQTHMKNAVKNSDMSNDGEVIDIYDILVSNHSQGKHVRFRESNSLISDLLMDNDYKSNPTKK